MNLDSTNAFAGLIIEYPGTKGSAQQTAWYSRDIAVDDSFTS